jgi:hypothetical protein
VLTLDLRYRDGPWQRPPEVHPVEAPYRLTDLVFYFYVLYTLNVPPESGQPPLGSHLRRLAPALSADQLDLARRALRELRAVKPRRPAFSDALGMLLPSKGPGQAAP